MGLEGSEKQVAAWCKFRDSLNIDFMGVLHTLVHSIFVTVPCGY